MAEYDVIILGGGIVGTSISRELSKYNIKLALIEANTDIGAGSTKGNGGVVHAGYDPKPDKLKAKLNVKGSAMYPELAKKLNFNYKNTGSFVVGFNDKDLSYLKGLLDNGKKNGVPGVEIINSEKIFDKEPNVSSKAKYALYAPTAAMVDPFDVAIAFAENASENGVEFFRNEKVISINKIDYGFLINTKKHSYKTKYIVNATGVRADEIANMVGIHDYTIKPRLGELLILDKSCSINLRTVLFPIPGPHTKGIGVMPTISGNVLVGSTAVMINDKEYLSNTTDGINKLLNGSRKLVPKISPKSIIREFVGLRAVAMESGDDFFIEASKEIPNFISAVGIQSPGIAASPAIAEYVRDILSNQGLNLIPKKDFKDYREPIADFSKLSDVEKDKIIKNNPSYGNIVCRCETVTEGEIISAIKRPVGATTIDGIKRRTRAGMGRCQSGFCQHKVLSILSRELNKSRDELLLENDNSNIVFGRLKG